MYDEFKSIKCDLETLLLRLQNIEKHIRKYDLLYNIDLLRMDIYISKEEVQRLLSIGKQEIGILLDNDFFTKTKKKDKKPYAFLLKDVIWLMQRDWQDLTPEYVEDLKHKRYLEKHKK